MTWDPPDVYSGAYPGGSEFEELMLQVSSLTTTWQDYNVTWGNDGTAPSLGNGSLTAEYKWPNESDLVFVRVSLTAGTTTTFGSSFQWFSLPVIAASTDRLNGACNIFDNGTIRRCACTFVKTTTQVYINSDSGTVSNTVPWTWANGDTIDFSLFYRAA